MSARLEELDWQETPLGELSLRRRKEPTLGIDIFEVKLGDEYLMSSLFTVAEEKLATLGLAAWTTRDGHSEDELSEDELSEDELSEDELSEDELSEDELSEDELSEDASADEHSEDARAAASDPSPLDVLVGGLGLGYTALAALTDPRVRVLTVIDALPAVIDWHRRLLLPVSAELMGDRRTRLVHDDFFAVMRTAPQVTYDAILLDVDHSPRHQLNPSHADLYEVSGLRAMARHLNPDGVFALWSDDPPDEEFMGKLGSVFATSAAHIIDFDNPVTGGVSSNTVYVAR